MLSARWRSLSDMSRPANGDEVRLTIRLPRRTHKALAKSAKSAKGGERSISWVVRKAIKAYLSRDKAAS